MYLKLRRYQNTLAISGIAVIALGLWNVIKNILIILLDPDRFQYSLDTPVATAFDLAFAIEGIVIFYGVFIAINLFVGLSAYREGTGKKRGKAYIVLGVVMAVVVLLGIATELATLFSAGPITSPDSVDAENDISATSLLLDVSALIALVELVVNAIRITRLTKLETK